MGINEKINVPMILSSCFHRLAIPACTGLNIFSPHSQISSMYSSFSKLAGIPYRKTLTAISQTIFVVRVGYI
jgi:hypothetical protein